MVPEKKHTNCTQGERNNCTKSDKNICTKSGRFLPALTEHKIGELGPEMVQGTKGKVVTEARENVVPKVIGELVTKVRDVCWLEPSMRSESLA